MDDYYLHSTVRVWKVEEIGDCSIIVSSIAWQDTKKRMFLPNPTDAFLQKHGKMCASLFSTMFETKFKDLLYTPETMVLYFEGKTPDWIEVGMEILY